jgi:hypothetical protein
MWSLIVPGHTEGRSGGRMPLTNWLSHTDSHRPVLTD